MYLASRWKRLVGVLIDTLVMGIIIIPIMFFLDNFNKNGLQLSLIEQTVFYIFSMLLYLTLNGYLIAKYGQTIGKRIVGTKMVDLNGQLVPLVKIFFFRIFIVSLIMKIPILGQFFGLVDCLFIFRKDRRCLHDIIAGTQVVDVRISRNEGTVLT